MELEQLIRETQGFSAKCKLLGYVPTGDDIIVRKAERYLPGEGENDMKLIRVLLPSLSCCLESSSRRRTRASAG